MKTYRDLFNQYNEGKLSDNKIAELHKILLDTYFKNPEDLYEDEFEYTEDLVFELFNSGNLERSKSDLFKERLSCDSSLLKRFNFHKSFEHAVNSYNENKAQNIYNQISVENQEEEELEEILEEVIENVHQETESTTSAIDIFKLWSDFKQSFLDLFSLEFFQSPQVRLALVPVSVLVLAIIIWIALPEKQNQFAENNTSIADSLSYGDTANIDTISSPDDENADEFIKRQKLDNLIAANFSPSPQIRYSVTRSIHSTSYDTLITGIKQYNNKRFDSCSLVLNNLIQNKSFASIDTTSMINFYLGNCYLSMAIEQKNEMLAFLATNAFNQIDKKTRYFIPSKWYSAFAYLRIGNINESIQLLDTLILTDTYKVDQARAMRDEILELQ